MSLHATLTPETRNTLTTQRRRTAISSFVVALLVTSLLAVILLLIAFSNERKEIPAIVSYLSPNPAETITPPKKVQLRTQPKPSAPSASPTQVIAAHTVTPVAVPVPIVAPPSSSPDFGESADFGENWGSGDGWGQGAGGTFFGQSTAAERIVYVIDFSSSMNSKGRAQLMRTEMDRSLHSLAPGTKFQMIFFSGPSWVAGQKVTLDRKTNSAIVMDGKKKIEWSGKNAGGWKPKGRLPTVNWLNGTEKDIAEAKKLVKNTPLLFGTSWTSPLEMALAMDPAPQAIFFLTDGLSGEDSEKIATTIAAKAKAKNITINTVSLMEPRAEKSMSIMAQRSGGSFTIVEDGGKRRQVLP